MKKVINIMGDSRKVSDSEVIKYFKKDKNKYLIYKKTSTDKIYLAKIEDNNLLDIDKDESIELQKIVKTLLSKEKDFDTLEDMGYKELPINELSDNYSEKGNQTIAVTVEQYQNIIMPVIKKKRKLKKGPLLILLFLLIAIVLGIELYKRNVEKEPEAYTVQFVTNSDYVLQNVEVTVGESINIYRFVPTKEGYKFEGWYKDATLTQNVYGTFTPTNDITLYAKWIEDKNYSFGDVVETIDNSTWIVLEDKNDIVTLFATECNMNYTLDSVYECFINGTCDTLTPQNSIYPIIKDEYLKSNLINLSELVTDFRFASKTEIEQLNQNEQIKNYVNACRYDKYWIMDINNQTYAVDNGNVIPTQISDTLGIKPVITITKEALKTSQN